MAQHDIVFTDYCANCHNHIPRVCDTCWQSLVEQNERAIKLLVIATGALEYLADDKHLIPFTRTLAKDTLAQMQALEG